MEPSSLENELAVIHKNSNWNTADEVCSSFISLSHQPIANPDTKFTIDILAFLFL